MQAPGRNHGFRAKGTVARALDRLADAKLFLETARNVETDRTMLVPDRLDGLAGSGVSLDAREHVERLLERDLLSRNGERVAVAAHVGGPGIQHRLTLLDL